MFVLRSVPFQKRSQVVGWAALLIGSLLASSSAFAQVPAARNPYLPSPANPLPPVWTEDFSSGTAAPTPLTTYLSPAYSADPDWLPGYNACNGWILNSNNTTAPASDSGCTSGGGRIVVNGTAAAGTRGAWLYLRRMAYQLGVAQNDPAPASNNVLASMTNGNKNQNASIQFETNNPQDPITVIPGHFYIGSAWFAEVHCQAEGVAASLGWTNSNESFSLLVGGAVDTIYSGFTPCVAPMGNVVPDGTAATEAGNLHVGHMQTPGWLAPSGITNVGVQISNGTPQYQGNDVAIDTPQLLDATPTLYKSFNPVPASSSDYTVGPAAVGEEVVTMTFIIVNTTDLQKKAGWSFTDALPKGTLTGDQLVVNSSPNVSSTCTNVAVTGLGGAALAGADAIEVTGTLDAGAATCTISVDVLAKDDIDSYVNAPGTNLKNLIGLVNPNIANLNVANLILEKTATIVDAKNGTVTEVLQAGNVITYTFTVTNPTNTLVTGLELDERYFTGGSGTTGQIDFGGATGCNTVFKPGPAGTGTEIPAAPGPGNSVSCTGTYTVQPSDMLASAPNAITNAATVTSSVPSGTSPESSTTVQVDKPALKVTKTASTTELVAGDSVTFYFLVENTGDVNLGDVAIDETTFTGSGTVSPVTCPSSDLAIGASMTCEATYTVTAADVAAGTIANTADAQGSVMGISGGVLTELVTAYSAQSTIMLRSPSSATVPTLDPRMLALLALLLGGVAAWSARRRVWE